MNSKGRVIGITGATGCLGAAWLGHALANDPDLRVVALARDPSAAATRGRIAAFPAGMRTRIEWVGGDLARLEVAPADVNRLRAPNTAWWHFAASTNLATDQEAEAGTTAVNDEGTARLLSLIRPAETRVPFLHVSTAFVAGARTGRVFETIAPAGTAFRNPYERSKARAEAHVWREFSAGARGAILRPSLVIHPDEQRDGGHVPEVFARALFTAMRCGERELVLRFEHAARINLITRDWVVRALAQLGRHVVDSDPPPAAYHLTAPRDSRLAEVAAAIEACAPGFSVSFQPDTAPGDLPGASRFLDRMLAGLCDYLAAGPDFDRSHAAAVLPRELAHEPCDLATTVALRIEATVGRPAIHPVCGSVPARDTNPDRREQARSHIPGPASNQASAHPIAYE